MRPVPGTARKASCNLVAWIQANKLYRGVSFGESRSRSCSDQWRIRQARMCSG
ncbi:hypothetical protein PISMIDRAFT_678502 [Pisolithus microcarpus 441]|uniref:Uncharacterized protein n=1 Tax=Pisolithus microcarpus 441 TaxID=765257 RepID=A0A0C9ZDP1_9AGAM|nr:hypothetical protein BKA83DRAFT_678502 [Pisolithus microcarpus]KIK24024.1 hypothetical protein PISMIDRAFT_678502 [Pisolithus microcarpus 441]